ncbi:MAG: RNA polymerase factor sigma-54 [Kiritimatiellia bacterium]|jgi:RNA polymerase sigma-54 factor
MANMGMGLSQQLRQKQILAPQMRQSLEVLQLQVQDLALLVQEELVQNPTLEDVSTLQDSIDAAREQHEGVDSPDRDFSDDDDGVADSRSADAEPLAAAERREASGEDDGDAASEDPIDFAVLAELDDVDYLYQAGGNNEYNPDLEERRQFMFDSIPVFQSLQGHLLDQLDLLDLEEVDRLVAEQIVGSIAEDGYLRTPLADIVQVVPGASMSQAERVLHVVQAFDPPGIGARNLRECLLLQIRQGPLQGTLAERIVEQHLNLVENRQFAAIADALGVAQPEVDEAMGLLAQLEPRPGTAFDLAPPTYVVPEIEVRKVDGRWTVFLEERDLPRLRISRRYLDMLQSEDLSDEVREYIQGKIRAGMNLIKSIEQRQETIRNVAQAIVDVQRDFFDHGVMALRPLVMATIAGEVGVHETTVSRTVSNKYMRSPQGIHELRYFFTSAISTEAGEDVSSERVKMMVKQIVEAEDPARPLSDQDIERKLADEGINIARRTIAKYRGILKIPASHRRRRT